MIGAFYSATKFADPLIDTLDLPSPYMYTAARFALWSIYGFATGLVGTGLWVLAHECGHQAFSESKTINNTVGWFLHSA
jgi:omega-6 fatty acid desaturase (delta-12 desaturase)